MAVISAIKSCCATNPLYGEEVKQYLTRFGPVRTVHRWGPDCGRIDDQRTWREIAEVLDTVRCLQRMDKVAAAHA